MGWSDLPSDLLISIATWLPEPGDYARFRAVCSSWESAVRGFRPAFFPWLAVIPNNHDPNKDELSIISHASNDCVYKRPLPCNNIDLDKPYVSNKDGWIMFVLDDCVPIIVNPVTGAQLQHLPSLYTLLSRRRRYPWRHIDFVVFLTDNLVAFAHCCVEGRHILAAAMPSDDEWSVLRLSPSYYVNNMKSIVFHKADRKFYAMHYEGDMLSFRLTRCRHKTVFGELSNLAEATRHEGWLVSHLVSDGTNLLRVRRRIKDFEILKYCPDADMWVKVTNMDLGNNSLFFDSYGAKLLPLPLTLGDGYLQRDGIPRRNCIYFTDYDSISPPKGEEEEEEDEEEEGYQYVHCERIYVHCVRIYDVDKGTVEPCFTTNIQSNRPRSPALMWFIPSLFVKN